MSRTWWMFSILILGTWLESHAQTPGPILAIDSKAEERSALVVPQWQVSLVSRSQYNPGLAVMTDEGVYYTHYIGNENCPGRRIIRVELKPSRVERVMAELPCVLNIKTDGTHVFAYYRDANGKGATRIAVWKKGQRIEDLKGDIDEATKNVHRARLAFAKDFGGVDPSVKIDSRELNFGNEKLLVDTIENGPSFWDVTSITEPRFKGDSPILVPNANLASLISDVGVDASGEHAYFQLAVGERGYARFLIGNQKRRVGLGLTTLGNDHGLGDDWTEVSGANWSIALPMFFTPTRYGFLVYEGSIGGDPRAVSYCEGERAICFRAALPGERFLTGVSYARRGQVISNGGGKEIFWMGNDKAQFGAAEGFLEADIRRNPRLPAVEKSESK